MFVRTISDPRVLLTRKASQNKIITSQHAFDQLQHALCGLREHASLPGTSGFWKADNKFGIPVTKPEKNYKPRSNLYGFFEVEAVPFSLGMKIGMRRTCQ